MNVRVLIGDCRELLLTLPSESVNCIVTSPPYFGLRDYQVAGQIGLEQTPDAYVAELVSVFREARRVLKNDGVMFLNLGDSYAGSGKGGNPDEGKQATNKGLQSIGVLYGKTGESARQAAVTNVTRKSREIGLKPKDLIGIPWRVGFALQADGWVLRQEICWSKPNPVPESVRDRCTKSHESIFLFAKAKWHGPSPGRYGHVSAEDARWLALFLDTEGNICLRRESPKNGDYGAHSAQVVFANSHRGLLDGARAIIGDGSILERPGKNAPMFYWQVCGKKAADLLAVVYPHLIVKQRQAQCLIHLETRKEIRGGHKRLTADEVAYRDRLWMAVKDLNHFGNPDISWVPAPTFGRWTDCERYHYDADAIAEPTEYPIGSRDDVPQHVFGGKNVGSDQTAFRAIRDTRNKRSVWTISTHPFPEAHFATFPPELPEICIKAGCPVGGIVLDPFSGAGTTGLVADRLGRNAILIEINPTYAAMAQQRIANDAGMFATVAAE